MVEDRRLLRNLKSIGLVHEGQSKLFGKFPARPLSHPGIRYQPTLPAYECESGHKYIHATKASSWARVGTNDVEM